MPPAGHFDEQFLEDVRREAAASRRRRMALPAAVIVLLCLLSIPLVLRAQEGFTASDIAGVFFPVLVAGVIFFSYRRWQVTHRRHCEFVVRMIHKVARAPGHLDLVETGFPFDPDVALPGIQRAASAWDCWEPGMTSLAAEAWRLRQKAPVDFGEYLRRTAFALAEIHRIDVTVPPEEEEPDPNVYVSVDPEDPPNAPMELLARMAPELEAAGEAPPISGLYLDLREVDRRRFLEQWEPLQDRVRALATEYLQQSSPVDYEVRLKLLREECAKQGLLLTWPKKHQPMIFDESGWRTDEAMDTPQYMELVNVLLFTFGGCPWKWHIPFERERPATAFRAEASVPLMLTFAPDNFLFLRRTDREVPRPAHVRLLQEI